MTVVVYAGSFDPITNGHLDIIKRGAKIFDKVIVAVAYNINKKSFLTVGERIELIKASVNDITNVEVDTYEGLTVEYAKKKHATVLLRGIRNINDYENESQLGFINSSLDNEIQTVYLISAPEYSYISSSCVKEILMNKGDIKKVVPQSVYEYLQKYC